MEIVVEPPAADDVHALLRYHLAQMDNNSPAEFAFALPVEDLMKANITFWTARERGVLLGFGALKDLCDGTGEIKSMRTAPQHLRRGVAGRILEVLIAKSRARNYSCLYLETGATDDYRPARQLYEGYGFSFCKPFSNYATSDFNRFMQLRL